MKHALNDDPSNTSIVDGLCRAQTIQPGQIAKIARALGFELVKKQDRGTLWVATHPTDADLSFHFYDRMYDRDHTETHHIIGQMRQAEALRAPKAVSVGDASIAEAAPILSLVINGNDAPSSDADARIEQLTRRYTPRPITANAS